ncbi:discoidin domain-containing protein [Ferrimonas balearica]|uniref:discoidin domain-containing protein n=1 Tax=Ferrimonas balearica TaxID=44012 RepID=UPI001C98FF1E|nr:discoidin domain-containing protein [Ferrimonas balearica]MBY5921252.1 discoidin domain-containing protein [Ferrimonas balearica]MBY5996063.1 discoidin domain-containing protein [Ferrimonas balearica]
MSQKIKKHLQHRPVIHFKGAISESPLRVKTDNKGRFVRFSLQAESSFHLDTIEIFNKDGRNIAPGKRTIISSVYNDEEKYDGRGALEGKKNGGCGFHTKREQAPWLIVDLGTVRNLDEIVVYNREGQYYTRALSLKIESSRDLTKWELIHDNWACLNAFDDGELGIEEVALLHAGVLDSGPAHNLITNLRKEGRHEQALKFHQYVNELVSERGLALGPHGFTQTFDLSSEAKKQKTYRELAQLLKWVNEEFGTPAFISSGTLLGIVRDGKFIGHDDDVDICYISKESTEQGIVEERQRLVKFLTEKGCRITPSDSAHYWCTTPGGVSLDIFTGFIEDGYCSMNPIGRKQVQVEAVLPLKTVQTNGVELVLPNDPEPLLVLNYGPSWRKPDPLWTFDWGQARRDFAFLYFK